MELKKEFLEAGGESFELIPCVNSSKDFVEGLAGELKNHSGLRSIFSTSAM